jgi:hypothetical protein
VHVAPVEHRAVRGELAAVDPEHVVEDGSRVRPTPDGDELAGDRRLTGERPEAELADDDAAVRVDGEVVDAGHTLARLVHRARRTVAGDVDHVAARHHESAVGMAGHPADAAALGHDRRHRPGCRRPLVDTPAEHVREDDAAAGGGDRRLGELITAGDAFHRPISPHAEAALARQ